MVGVPPNKAKDLLPPVQTAEATPLTHSNISVCMSITKSTLSAWTS